MSALDGRRETIGNDPFGLGLDDVYRRPVGTDDGRDALQLPPVRVGEQQRGNDVGLACSGRPDGVGTRGCDRGCDRRCRRIQIGGLRGCRHAGRQLGECHLAYHGMLHLAVLLDISTYEPASEGCAGRGDRPRVPCRRYKFAVQIVIHGSAVVGDHDVRPGIQRYGGFGEKIARPGIDVVLQLRRIVAEILSNALCAGEQVIVLVRRSCRELEQRFNRLSLRDGRVVFISEVVAHS